MWKFSGFINTFLCSLLNKINDFLKYITLFYILLLPAEVLSQPLILQRSSSEIPYVYLNSIINTHRKVIYLNGEWNFFSSDPYINSKIRVPFCYDFKGKVIVSREFNIDIEDFDKWNYILYCDGINYQCEITLNGNFIVKHEGGFTPISSMIQESFLKKDNNKIEIVCDNLLDYTKTVPLRSTYNYPKNYGGIYRDIYILAVPKVYINSVNVTSEIDINYNADIQNIITITSTDISKLNINPESDGFTVKTEITDTNFNIVASSQGQTFNISSNSTIQVKDKLLFSNPSFWSPGNPNLYYLRVILSYGEQEIDSYRSDFGLFEFSKKGNTLQVNRSEFRFKGINYIEEFHNNGICASYSEIELDIANIKAAGCNTLRVTGRPASPYLLSICNRTGIFILEEIPVMNVPSSILIRENFIALAENQLNEMITQHKNNPSVFAYGLGNNINVSDFQTKEYLQQLSSFCKKLDQRFDYYTATNIKEDICYETVDMVGLNFYDKDIKILKEIVSEPQLKNRIVFLSDYGKIINPRNQAGYSDPYSIEAQSKYIIDVNKIIKASSFSGSFFMSYSDWNTDFPNLHFYNSENQNLRTSGIYSLNRELRSPGTILKKIYLDEDLPNLNIGTYSREAPVVFVIIGILTFIVFIYLVNSVRRFRENVGRALFRPFIFFTDVREQNLIGGFYNLVLALIISIGNGLFFANLFYYWKESQYFDLLLSVILGIEPLKELADTTIINPLKLVLILSLITLIKIFICSFIIWLFSLTTKFRIRYNNIFTVIVWGLLPTLLLLIIGTFYVRILFINPDFAETGLIIAGILYLISFYRILKGTYIIFDTFFLKAYTYGIFTVAVLYGGIWFYLDGTKYISDYISLVMSYLN